MTESAAGGLNWDMLGPDICELSRGPGWLFVSWRDVYILDWRTTLTRASLDASMDCVERATEQFSNGFGVINILHPPMQLPTGDVREYAQEKILGSSPLVRCHATILTEQGFWSSTMRAALTGLYMLQKTPFPRKVFGSRGEAVEWCRVALEHDDDWTRGVLGAIEEVTRESAAA